MKPTTSNSFLCALCVSLCLSVSLCVSFGVSLCLSVSVTAREDVNTVLPSATSPGRNHHRSSHEMPKCRCETKHGSWPRSKWSGNAVRGPRRAVHAQMKQRVLRICRCCPSDGDRMRRRHVLVGVRSLAVYPSLSPSLSFSQSAQRDGNDKREKEREREAVERCR